MTDRSQARKTSPSLLPWRRYTVWASNSGARGKRDPRGRGLVAGRRNRVNTRWEKREDQGDSGGLPGCQEHSAPLYSGRPNHNGPISKAILEAAGINPNELDAYVTGDRIERKKPAPDLFLVAARELGLPPADCVVVEDAITGVEAATAAGAKALAVTNSFPREQLHKADKIVFSLEEVDLVSLTDLIES